MNETRNSPECERAADLIAFVYNEASDAERRDFESHLNECHSCREEVASFGVVRESITTWRDEVLSGFVAMPLPSQAPKRSALAAFGQFFDLSPLWLKGATAVAVLAFFLLGAIAIFRTQTNTPQITKNPDQLYTAQDVDRMLKEALAKQQEQTLQQTPNDQLVQAPEPPKKRAVKSTTQMAKSRRPLSRAEREQLAADLRLLSGLEDSDLHLLGDRINQQ